jgi:hypothetical protein
MAKAQSRSGVRILRGSKDTRGGYSGSALKQAPKRPSSSGAGTPANSSAGGTQKSAK